MKTLVVPEGGELPPEEELAALEAAEAEAAAAAAEEAEAEHAEAEAVIAEVVAEEEVEEEDSEGESDGCRRGRRARCAIHGRRAAADGCLISSRTGRSRERLAVASLAALLVVGSASADPSAQTRVTVIGDSITASFDYVPAARRYLARGFDLRSDAVVCRRLVASSCAFRGSSRRRLSSSSRTSAERWARSWS